VLHLCLAGGNTSPPVQFVAVLKQHKICLFFPVPFASNFRLSRADCSALAFLMPAQSLPPQCSAPGVRLQPCCGTSPASGLGWWQSQLALNRSHKCFTFAKHPSEQESFKLNTILGYLCSVKGMPGTFSFTWTFISTLSFEGESKLAQGLGHLVLDCITVQGQFLWPNHTELQQDLRRAVLHLSHQLHRSAVNAIWEQFSLREDLLYPLN